jgi:hypothetical protein
MMPFSESSWEPLRMRASWEPLRMGVPPLPSAWVIPTTLVPFAKPWQTLPDEVFGYRYSSSTLCTPTTCEADRVICSCRFETCYKWLLLGWKSLPPPPLRCGVAILVLAHQTKNRLVSTLNNIWSLIKNGRLLGADFLTKN